jgi:hypothetical protein
MEVFRGVGAKIEKNDRPPLNSASAKSPGGKSRVNQNQMVYCTLNNRNEEGDDV